MIQTTTNRLHFEDLEPHRFEDLACEILQKERNWKKFYPFGRKGNDDGLDIYGRRDRSLT